VGVIFALSYENSVHQLCYCLDRFDQLASKQAPMDRSPKRGAAARDVAMRNGTEHAKMNGVAATKRDPLPSPGDTLLDEHEFYEHNMSRRLQRLQMIVDRAESQKDNK